MRWDKLDSAIDKAQRVQKYFEFSSEGRLLSDGEARTADGRLFHALGAATGNARSPKVDRRTMWRCRSRRAQMAAALNVGYRTDAESEARSCAIETAVRLKLKGATASALGLATSEGAAWCVAGKSWKIID